tara:strand:+ start:1412 stop:1762 length:351 start_codon:yes stop_codon:yes gene_type:complete
MNAEIINFLNKCNLVFDTPEQLNNMEVSRDIFLQKDKYEEIRGAIDKMKQFGFSSSALTSLQKNAFQKQKWPLLNLVRQILRANNYKMIPVRKCKGSTKAGKKIYVRSFKILKSIP